MFLNRASEDVSERFDFRGRTGRDRWTKLGMNEECICVERRAKSQRNPSRNGGDMGRRSRESSLCPGWLRRREGVDCETGTTPGGPSFGTCVDGGGMVRPSELRAGRTGVRRWVGVDECSGSERQRAHNLLELEAAHCNTQADLVRV